MGYTFRPARRENIGLIIGLAGASGSGKTYSAMELATGMCGDKRFAVIDSENGRAKFYADRFAFDHANLEPPFRPVSYAESVKAADEAGYPVIVVDSMSHEHAGTGGLLEWHEEELVRMAGDDYKKRERVKMAAWIKPKMAHKAMMSALLRTRAHLILCFRAEEKTGVVQEGGKMKIVDLGWKPTCEKTVPYELTASFMLVDEKPGVPRPLKLPEPLISLFPTSRPISQTAGEGLCAWARGDEPAIVRDIRGASSLEVLEAIGKAIKDAGLNEADIATARDAYKKRLAELKASQPPADNPPDDAGVPA